jgi:hypothetical protein
VVPSAMNERVRGEIGRAFPGAFGPSARRWSRGDLVEMRQELPLYNPADVLELLPVVLCDLIDHHSGEEARNAEFVIYFLDVLKEARSDPRQTAEMEGGLERIARNVSPLLAARLREMLYRRVPEPPPGILVPGALEDPAAEDRRQRALSFLSINADQASAIRDWLALAARWPELDLCRDDVASALKYWSGGATEVEAEHG